MYGSTMTVAQQVKRLIPKTLRSSIGRSIRVRQRTSYNRGIGRDFISEISGRLPDIQIKTIFDVGAYIGLTAMEFSDAFPSATVFAFEPVSDSFRKMQQVLIGKPDIRKYQIALGSAKTTGHIHIDPEHMSTCSILDAPDSSTQAIKIETIDGFCTENKIASIDVMKIDTEGHELQVLAGARAMLSSRAISLIKLECAVDPDSDNHTQFLDICEILHPLGYRLFGLYDQFECYIDPKPKLRRFDAAFISMTASA
jgi:FkbM family methyltransferase